MFDVDTYCEKCGTDCNENMVLTLKNIGVETIEIEAEKQRQADIQSAWQKEGYKNFIANQGGTLAKEEAFKIHQKYLFIIAWGIFAVGSILALVGVFLNFMAVSIDMAAITDGLFPSMAVAYDFNVFRFLFNSYYMLELELAYMSIPLMIGAWATLIVASLSIIYSVLLFLSFKIDALKVLRTERVLHFVLLGVGALMLVAVLLFIVGAGHPFRGHGEVIDVFSPNDNDMFIPASGAILSLIGGVVAASGAAFACAVGLEQFKDKTLTVANSQSETTIKWANSGLTNAIFGIAFSIWTIIAVTALTLDTVWGVVFIAIDFTASIPALFSGWRGRAHSNTKFALTMLMGVVSIIASTLALILLLTQPFSFDMLL